MPNSRVQLLAFILIANAFILLGAPLNPLIAVDQFERRINPAILLNPDSLMVLTFDQEFEAFLKTHQAKAQSTQRLRDPQLVEIEQIEVFVRAHITYRSDVLNYLAFDYLSTDIEIIHTRIDDCDGRAILATSLLLRRGYDAWVLVAPRHYWVEILLDSGRMHILEEDRSGEWYLKFNGTQKRYNWAMILMLVGAYVVATVLMVMLPPSLYRILTANTLYRNLLLIVLSIYFGFIISYLLIFE